ncbi:uncharacterized protein PV06_02134 [Exophiala oligosperma]|uniref:Zn(2)-C6 fungal-type domain-containing protein n=1 Tax=Exophiala oligosperma TaxID=215243 RepID=A0A0D2DTL5_9EURO|nr:uncharacterized protein PV06_02134 [Exophiala oligosperma]KIW46463.1 hypothetical protein PV06_02134 [Exophiala oligosperma]
MSQTPSENVATSSGTPSAYVDTPSSGPAHPFQLRSCVTCRARKVRCDRRSPCSNCRRGNIVCVFPSGDRPPRWARRLEHLANDPSSSSTSKSQMASPVVDQVEDRLRALENLVKELSSQLNQARAAAAAAGSANGGSSGVNSPGSSAHADLQSHPSPSAEDGRLNKQFGRLVVQDASSSRYVTGGFWSRVDDDLSGLEVDNGGLAADEPEVSKHDPTPGNTPSTQEIRSTASERYAFLFRHNLNPLAPDSRSFHPLPSQIPFILDVFAENVNLFYHIVHVPTVAKMVRDLRGSGMSNLTPSHEALMFSIYYAAIMSMEEDDILTNFGSSKADLASKYRYGLEHFLAKADFLNAPDIVLVQALSIFLFLARRDDSPRFAYMMTGLLVRMAQYLGLQRDGDNFKHLTPFDTDLRRRVWWAVVILDIRSAEDQGTDMAIPQGSFDTKMPWNINDTDIDPETKQVPAERHGLTDRAFTRINIEINKNMRQMTAAVAAGSNNGAGLEEQSRLLNDIWQRLDEGYLQYAPDTGSVAHWVAVTIARLVMAKMTLIVFLPVLFSSSPSGMTSESIRMKLLIAAIEVAEYNHMLNAEEAARHWRWIYQTRTHWHAIVYLLIETCRRPWSPLVERAWVALHSPWLIPARVADRNSHHWIPLRKLMAQSRKHRNTEIERLRADPQAAVRLEMEYSNMPTPSSSGTFPDGRSADVFLRRWRDVIATPAGPTRMPNDTSTSARRADATPDTNCMTLSGGTSIGVIDLGDVRPIMNFAQGYVAGIDEQQTLQTIPGLVNNTQATFGESTAEHDANLAYRAMPTLPTDGTDGDRTTTGAGFVTWLWTDSSPSADDFAAFDNVNMDLDGGMDWYSWIESAKGIE